jgi:hypothetical protein
MAQGDVPKRLEHKKEIPLFYYNRANLVDKQMAEIEAIL